MADSTCGSLALTESLQLPEVYDILPPHHVPTITHSLLRIHELKMGNYYIKIPVAGRFAAAHGHVINAMLVSVIDLYRDCRTTATQTRTQREAAGILSQHAPFTDVDSVVTVWFCRAVCLCVAIVCRVATVFTVTIIPEAAVGDHLPFYCSSYMFYWS